MNLHTALDGKNIPPHSLKCRPGASLDGGWRESPPRKKKERKKENEKKRKKRKKEKRELFITPLLLHIKCCFFQFFNSPVALRNEKLLATPKKKLK